MFVDVDGRSPAQATRLKLKKREMETQELKEMLKQMPKLTRFSTTLNRFAQANTRNNELNFP
jgi:hypothetical protein